MNNYAEKRTYERIFFSREQRVEGLLSLHGDGGGLKVIVLNLSEGGLQFIQKREHKTEIKKGDRLTLKGLVGPDPLNFMRDIELEIKWVLDHDFLAHLSYGCEFLEMPKDMQEVIRDVVDAGMLGTKDQ